MPAPPAESPDDRAFAAALAGDPYDRHEPRAAAVDFSLEEPESFDRALGQAGAEPDTAIAFDDFGGAVDDDGIPVWEDPP